MVWLSKFALLGALLAYELPSAPGQEPSPSEDPQYEFISGVVSEFSSSKIVVNRALLGKPPEDREFLITAQTKIEGKMHNGVRVTVGFKPTDEGDVAMRIIVRPAAPKKD
ncbi:MAG: hypothetical protein WKF37_14000 [Bryobacteraceae bacterium]